MRDSKGKISSSEIGNSGYRAINRALTRADRRRQSRRCGGRRTSPSYSAPVHLSHLRVYVIRLTPGPSGKAMRHLPPAIMPPPLALCASVHPKGGANVSMSIAGLVLPQLSAFDPPVASEGSLDPMGLAAISDRLANVLVPGLRARMQRVRFVTATAVGALACETLADELPADNVSTPAICFEWLVVESSCESCRPSRFRSVCRVARRRGPSWRAASASALRPT